MIIYNTITFTITILYYTTPYYTILYYATLHLSDPFKKQTALNWKSNPRSSRAHARLVAIRQLIYVCMYIYI